MQAMNIKRVVTVNRIVVDAVVHDTWEANRNGIKDIVNTDHGVHVRWNFGSTFVPWSNVRYVTEAPDVYSTMQRC